MAATQTPDERLVSAVSKHDLAAVKKALAEGANPNTEQPYGFSLLGKAARAGGPKSDVPIVRVLLAAGANPDVADVLAYCRVELVTELIAAGAHVDGPDRDGLPLFETLAGRTKSDKAMALLDAGARISCRDSAGLTILMAAAKSAQNKVVKRLLEMGADPTEVDQSGRTALRHAVEALQGAMQSQKAPLRAIVAMLERFAPGQPEDLLLTAIVGNDLAALQRMLDGGMDPNLRIQGTIGLSGLHNLLPTLKADGLFGVLGALTQPIDSAKLDKIVSGTTPLMWAVALDKPEVVRLLLTCGADGNLQTANGVSACEMSISKSNELIKKLLGTQGIYRKEAPAGARYTPNLTAGVKSTDSRSGRLGIDRNDLEDRSRWKESLPPLNRHATIGAWELLSVEHVREDKPAQLAAAKATLSFGRKYFSAKWPKADEENWMQAYPCALAAASLLRDIKAATALAKWINPSRPRGERSTYYNEQYFYWPLYQIWAAHLLGTKPQPALRKMIERESPRMPKLLLEATDALLARDGKALGRSLQQAIGKHALAATNAAGVRPDRLLSPHVCWLASEAEQAGIKYPINPKFEDWFISSVQAPNAPPPPRSPPPHTRTRLPAHRQTRPNG